MAWTQVWDDEQHIFLGNVIYAHHYVYADLDRVNTALSTAFAYQVDLRVGSADIAHARKEPLANGALGTGQIGTYGSVSGEIDDWGAKTANGDNTGDWSQAASVHFLVVSKGDIAPSLEDLIALVPAVGPVLSAAAKFTGAKVPLTIAHNTITIPIQRDATSRIVAINSVTVPQLATVS